MKKNLRIILQRTALLLFPTFILSATITGLNVSGIITTRIPMLFSLVAGVIAFTVLNIRFSRNSFFILRNLPRYYLINAIAFMLYLFILFATYIICGNIIFTWFFCITKFAAYFSDNITTDFAVTFFSFLQIIVIAVSPLGMSFLFMYHENKNEEI